MTEIQPWWLMATHIREARDKLAKLPPTSTLMVRAQNPSDNHHWTKTIVEISAERLAVVFALAASAVEIADRVAVAREGDGQ